MKVPGQQFKRKDRPAKMDKNVSDADMAYWKDNIRYTGSPEHKRAPWNGIKAGARANAAICPVDLPTDFPQKMLEAAIAAGNVSELRDDEWPRYVWYLDGEGHRYTARLTRKGGKKAEYKGWPEENLQAIPSGAKQCTL